MNYPLNLTFKLLALASQIYVRDVNGNILGYVKQKLFKLKEDINVYADENQNRLLFNIKADRVLDFSARYNFTGSNGEFLGSIKRQGMRSIWKAHYEIFDARDQKVLEIREQNPWTKVFDALVGEVPIVGMFTGYLFNPAYLMTRPDNSPVLIVKKQPAFFESKYELQSQTQISVEEENLVLLSSLMLALMERNRS
jgi:uncharacterized protein YxjI